MTNHVNVKEWSQRFRAIGLDHVEDIKADLDAALSA